MTRSLAGMAARRGRLRRPLLDVDRATTRAACAALGLRPWDDPHNCHSGTVYSDPTHLQARFGEHGDPRFPGWNLDCSDHAVREPEWEREFHA